MTLRLPVPPLSSCRSLFLLLLAAALLLATRGAAGGEGGTPAQVIAPGSPPVTETWAEMVARERQFRTRFPGGLRMLPPIPPNPRPKRERGPGQPGPDRYLAPEGPGGRRPGIRAPQTLGTNFRGISFDDQVTDLSLFTLPPDTTGAVGPSHFMEIINGSVAVFNKAGTRLNHISLDAFSAVTVSNVTYPRNSGFDPRLIFDRRSGRWFATIMDRGDPVGTDNDIILAVSRTADPTGQWDKYLLPVGDASGGGATFFTDYSTLAVDDNGVYFGMTIFPSNAPGFAKLIATPKAPLVAGSPSLGTVFQFTNINDLFSSPQPAHNFDTVGPTGRAWFVSSSTTVFGNINYRTLTWSGGVPTLSATSVLPTPAYGDLSPLDAPASGSTTPADSGDDRLQMAVIRNGRLWTCRTVGVNSVGTSTSPDRTACEWMELDVTGPVASLVQSGRVFDSAISNPRFYFYPSIMVSGQGHAMMGFSGVRSNEFIGAFTAGRLATDSPGTMRTIDQFRSGESAYTQVDSIGRNRWGDYSYTSLDPSDDMTFWTIQEYARPEGAQFLNGSKSRWGTWVAQARAPAPTLSNPAAGATLGQNGLVLQLNGTGFFDPGAGFANRLAVQITGGSGITVTGVTVNSSTQVTATVDVSAGAALGARTVTVTNPDGQSASVAGGLTIVGSTVELSAATYTAGEGDGAIVITVNRNGTAGSASVNYSVQPDTATAADFTPASGTLSFGPGEGTKTFTVAGVADNLLEGNETVQITLSSPTGTSLGTQSTATLTLTDNLTSPAPTGLQATILRSDQIRVSWTDNCGNEDHFRIERRDGANGNFTALGNPNSSPFMDTTAGPGVSYTYRVIAVRGGLESSPSAGLNTTIPAGGKLKITPLKLAFGRIRLSRPPTKTVKITNLGRGTLLGSVGPVAAPYQILQGAGSFNLARNKSHTVKIKFAPAAAGTEFPGNITITSTDPLKKEVLVPFTGAAR